MPKGVPVATMAVNGARNAGLLAVRILALGRPGPDGQNGGVPGRRSRPTPVAQDAEVSAAEEHANDG